MIGTREPEACDINDDSMQKMMMIMMIMNYDDY
jgi:hypothetical protein